MNNNTILQIVALICITVLESIVLLTKQFDGMVLSSVVGAIVFVATKKYYTVKAKEYK